MEDGGRWVVSDGHELGERISSLEGKQDRL